MQRLFYTMRQLRQAANAVHGLGYIVKPQHVGGRGDVLTLIPKEPAERTTDNTYFVATTDEGAYVHTPAPQWGEYDRETMQRFNRALRDTAPLAPTPTPTTRRERLFKSEVSV